MAGPYGFSPRGPKCARKIRVESALFRLVEAPRPRRAQRPAFKRNHEWTRDSGISDCAARPARFITRQWCVVRDLSFHPWQAVSMAGSESAAWMKRRGIETEPNVTRKSSDIVSRLPHVSDHVPLPRFFIIRLSSRGIHRVFTEHPVGQWNYR